MVDLSVFDRLKTKADYDREEQEFQLRKLAKQKMLAGDTPAAIKIADEIQKRRMAGDEAGASLIENAHKMYDKGVQYDPETGQYIDMRGYGGALGNLKYGENFGGETATQQVKSAYEPARAQDVRQRERGVDLVMNPQIKQAETSAAEVGKREGEAKGTLNFLEANLPKLEAVTQKLNKLGETATYTNLGRAEDFIQREAGFDPGQDARDRAEYIAIVDNEVLPLLRDTFGAQFTVQEGESLRATLGDANKSRGEKAAILDAFINQKKQQVDALKRQTGQAQQQPTQAPQPQQADPRNIPMAAVKYLRENPQFAEQFDQKYGAGAAKMVMGNE